MSSLNIQSPIPSDLDNIILRMGTLWEQFRNKSLFISGGSGFFGRWLLESFARANQQLGLNLKVTVLTRDALAFKVRAPHLTANPAISFHTGDVTNFVFPKRQYSHLIHAATTSAYETYRGETPLAKFDTLVRGTRRVLDFAAQCGVEQFLFTSSGVAYGGLELNPAIDESCNSAPSTIDSSTALGQGKRAAEFLCATYAEEMGFNMTIARCFSFVGPFQPLDIHYAIGNFILQAINNKTILIRGDGTPLRSFLYSGDLVTWLLTLLLRKGTTDIYNVGSDSAISINNLANLVKETTNSTSTIEIQGNPSHSTGNPLRSTYIPSISRARNELGLDVWTPLSKAIQLTSQHAIFCQNNDHHQTFHL